MLDWLFIWLFIAISLALQPHFYRDPNAPRDCYEFYERQATDRHEIWIIKSPREIKYEPSECTKYADPLYYLAAAK